VPFHKSGRDPVALRGFADAWDRCKGLLLLQKHHSADGRRKAISGGLNTEQVPPQIDPGSGCYKNTAAHPCTASGELNDHQPSFRKRDRGATAKPYGLEKALEQQRDTNEHAAVGLDGER
jgi:hypothetical protein